MTASAFASYAVTEAELEERLVGTHGPRVGAAMTASVFHDREIPVAVLEERLINQFGEQWHTFSPERRDWHITNHRELLANAAKTEARRPPRGEFDPNALEVVEAEIKAEVRRQERIELIERTLRPTFPYDPGSPEPDGLRHDNAAFRLRLEERMAQEQARRWEVEQALDEIAARHGIGRTGRHPDGRGWTLVGEGENVPILMTTQNAIAAATTFAADLWPTGLYPWQDPALTRNLTGAGVTTAIWEADPNPGILTTHQEFLDGGVSRATQVDSAPPGDHATAVAGAIAGGGNVNVFIDGNNMGRLLRGVVYESEIRGHSLLNFSANTVASVLGGQRFSNHSYGELSGWEIVSYQGALWWFWRFPEFDKDPRLGMYAAPAQEGISSADLDAFVFSNEIQLPVYAAGNARFGGPGQPVVYLTLDENGVPVTSTAERAWFNGGLPGETWTASSVAYNTVLNPSTAKNVLSVGSIQDATGATIVLSSFSGTGPTDDGRIKPDLVAVGERNTGLGLGNSLFLPRAGSDTDYYEEDDNLRGTSFSAPQVTGALALAQARREELFPNASPWLASTWRALAIHTAEDVATPGPTYKKGWGIFDAVALVERIEADAELGRGALIKEFEVEEGEPQSFLVNLPADTTGRLTIAWNDPAGDPAPTHSVLDDDTPMLVNDIDLLVEDMVTGETYYPWILDPDFENQLPQNRGAPAINTVINGVEPRDDRNNVERIDIEASPQARTLRVHVSPYGLIQDGPQKVSMVLSGAIPEAPVAREFASSLNPQDEDEVAFTFTSDPGAYFTLETQPFLESGDWTAVETVHATNDVTTVLISRNPNENRRFWRIRRGE